MTVSELPRGNAPSAVSFPHFPDRLHAFLWRNWSLVPLERMAAVVNAKLRELRQLGRAMGLPNPPRISPDQWRRSYITVLKRNWHLLPYEQLLVLLDFTPEEMAYTLREDDFLYIKLGNHKPVCEPLRFAQPEPLVAERATRIGQIVREEFPRGLDAPGEPLFAFVSRLSAAPEKQSAAPRASGFAPRFCYSYFALYGDPLLDQASDSYPDGYLARLAASGVDGVWMQAVLYKLAPFPWDANLSARYEERLKNLGRLVARAQKHGIKVWLYLNEPRQMPVKFFAAHPELKGVTDGDQATLCTSQPAVQDYLRNSIATICQAVPGLGGFFTISASENRTHCWSHGAGAGCPRCGKRPPADVIAEVNRCVWEGIQRSTSAAGPSQKRADHSPTLIVWDWGWNDAWSAEVIAQLPQGVSFMSVSEWNLPIERGGIKSAVGEYSISAIGPGPRATRHWELARKRGLKTIAKIQAGNTWELSAVPYIPAVENVARHAAALRGAGVDGLMLGWTLGGSPSPNLEVVAEMGADAAVTPEAAMQRVAERRYGSRLAPNVVTAWRECSAAFREFPYYIGVLYSGPQNCGPSNLLWTQPTGYPASMVGFPYDDLDGWRGIYPPETFIAQFARVADGFDAALEKLQRAMGKPESIRSQHDALEGELTVMEAAGLHFRSAANQARFIVARRALAAAKNADEARAQIASLEQTLRDELRLARRMFELQHRDSRLGFEASNQYFYVPMDLAEKVLNCRDLLERWIPDQRKRWNG